MNLKTIKSIDFKKSTLWPLISIVCGISLFLIVQFIPGETAQWTPQALVTLLGLIGAAWFAGHRLELIERDIHLRHDSTDRTNFNNAIKAAVDMLSSESNSNCVAGQLWLHSLANQAEFLEATLLAQSLLCTHVTSKKPNEECHAATIETRQSAINLLFKPPHSSTFFKCDQRPNLQNTSWYDLDLQKLELRRSDFMGGDFRGARLSGANFNHCNLSNTTWSDVGSNNIPTTMKDAQLGGTECSSVTFTSVDFTGSSFYQTEGFARFNHVTFQRCIFNNCVLKKSNFVSCTFLECNFANVDLSKANWKDVTFSRCRGQSAENFAKFGKSKSR